MVKLCSGNYGAEQKSKLRVVCGHEPIRKEQEAKISKYIEYLITNRRSEMLKKVNELETLMRAVMDKAAVWKEKTE